jgi:hypothetical protein
MYRPTFSSDLALARREWSASGPGRFTPGGKSPRYPLDRRLGVPQSRPGLRGEEKIIDSTATPTTTPR